MRKLLLFLGVLIAGAGTGWLASRFGRSASGAVQAQRPVIETAGSVIETAGPHDRTPVAPKFAVDPSAYSSPAPRVSSPSPAAPANPVFTEQLRMRGWVKRGRRINVVMTDGTVFTEHDKELQAVERNSVTIAGKRYAMVAPAPSSVSINSGLRGSEGAPPHSEPEAKTGSLAVVPAAN